MSITTWPALGGIILAGGQSRRMGTPKAFLRLTAGGPTLIELVLARVAAVASEIVIVTNQPELYRHLGRPLVGDQFVGLGSLAGIQAGLTASAQQHSLIVACDMPFLSPALLAYLAQQPRDYDVLIPRRADGQLETLHAIYSRACLPAITAQLSAGEAKITRFFDQVRVVTLDEPLLRPLDPTLRSFDNLNTPTDYDSARQQPPSA